MIIRWACILLPVTLVTISLRLPYGLSAHPDLLISNYYSTDHTRDNAQSLILPQLSSRMKHIKQEMAKNHLQFVRFEATDLHGVSRSKSIPAQFFQVSFTVMLSVAA